MAHIHQHAVELCLALVIRNILQGVEQFFQVMDRRSKKFVFVIDKFEFTVPFAIFVIENTNCIVADSCVIRRSDITESTWS